MIDLAGKTFGEWTVLARGKSAHGSLHWRCRCSCGTEREVDGPSLRYGRSTRCLSCKQRTHGMSDSPEYRSWNAMNQRCNATTGYAAGVTVVARWKGRGGFANFFKDMGPRPPGTTLDRENRKKGYSKANCRWADRTTQTQNRSVARMVLLDGKPVTLGRLEVVMRAALRAGTASFEVKTIISPSVPQ